MAQGYFTELVIGSSGPARGRPLVWHHRPMAAAYLFYLCKNRPLIGENQRAALGACLVFLRLNGIEPKADGPEWEDLTLDVAASGIDREGTDICENREGFSDQ